MTNEKILTTEEAAELLQSHKKTIEKKIRAGELRAYKRLRRWFILYSDLIEFIKSGTEEEE